MDEIRGNLLIATLAANRVVCSFQETVMNEANCSGLDEYVIKVRSHLDEVKSYWFEGMKITTGYDEDGQPITTFTGRLADQTALHGVLAKIRDMNLPLISVSRVSLDSVDDP